MSIKMLKRTKTSIGLDIGSHSIKMVEVKLSPASSFMTNFSIKKLPHEPSSDIIAENIKELFQEKNIKAKNVTIGVSGANVAIRHLRLPAMPKSELKEAVRWETKKLISFPPDKAIIEFQILGDIIEEEINKLDLLVTAVDANFIKDQLSVFKNADLKITGISTIPHGLWHCLQTISEANKGIVALIDIGAKKTTISIVKNNQRWSL